MTIAVTIESVPELVVQLCDHQLLEPAQVQVLTAELLPQAVDPSTLTRQLVQRGWLTRFQADQVLEGRAQDLILGPYRLLELLGEGGMGQVFKAVQLRLGRVVALKIIRPERVAQNPQAVSRFQREARTAAQLSHANMVVVYDADEINGRHFIAMEYLEGLDLAQLVRESGPLPISQACDYILQAALGLAHAHECGLIHRDIKPSNLFFTRPPGRGSLSSGRSGLYRPVQSAAVQTSADNKAGERPRPSPAESGSGLPGIIKILDMGLARLIDPEDDSIKENSLTRDGAVMGTPDYIAPEQARNSHQVDTRADLYSLGCTFYYLLTGRPPFPNGTAVEKLLMHQLDQPRPVGELRPDLPPEASAVVHKLMAKQREDRYQTAAELVEALTPLVVLPSPPTMVRLVAPSATEASMTRVVAVQVVPSTPPPEGSRSASDPTPAGRSASRLPGAQKLAVLKGHRGWVLALAFAPDRNRLASGGVDGTVQLWDFTEGTPRQVTLPAAHYGEVNALAFTPDNQLLASGSGTQDGMVYLWDVSGPQPRVKAALRGQAAPVDTLAFSADGKLLACASGDAVRLWDLKGKEPRERLTCKGHSAHVKAVAFAPDGKTVATGSQDGTVRLWDTAWRFWSQQRTAFRAHDGQVRSLAFAPDGQTLASGSVDPSVQLWDVRDSGPRLRAALEGNTPGIQAVLFTPDGSTLVSVAAGGMITFWEVASGQKSHELALPGVVVSTVALTRDGRYLSAGNSDGQVLVFRLGNKQRPEDDTPPPED